MSEWYEAEDDEIKVDFERERVDLYVTANDFGRIYLMLSFKQLLDIAEEIKNSK